MFSCISKNFHDKLQYTCCGDWKSDKAQYRATTSNRCYYNKATAPVWAHCPSRSISMSFACPVVLRAAINSLPADWRRRRNPPRRIWLRTVDLDLQPLHKKNKITRMGFFMDSPLNSRPCHVGWPQDKVAKGKHVGFTSPWFHTEERSKASRGDGHVHGSTCHHMTMMMMMMMMMMMFCADHWANIIAADAETVIVTRSQERSGCNSCCVCIL